MSYHSFAGLDPAFYGQAVHRKTWLLAYLDHQRTESLKSLRSVLWERYFEGWYLGTASAVGRDGF